MNYIYDIYLNLNERLYDFFDWNKNDKIVHIKKIPIIKVSEENMKVILSNKIQISDKILSQIYNKTEIWNLNNKIDYCALFSNCNTILAIEFNAKGKSIKKSFLFVDEELEVLEIINKLCEKSIEYKIICKENNNFKTRKQEKEEKFVNNELKNMDDNKLNYIYFECFGKTERNKKIIIDELNKISKTSKTYKNLYEILKLTSTTKK